MQENWIGRSEGLLLRFELEPSPSLRESEIEVYTTRPDTLFGAKFMALAADHPLAADCAEGRPGARRLHRGMPAEGHVGRRDRDGGKERLRHRPRGRAIRSIADWLLPVYVANFVLMDYGTGAIFGCPAHDQRDLDFANAYGLGNTPVICPPGVDPATFAISDDRL